MPPMSDESYHLLKDFLQNYYHAEFNYSNSLLTKETVEALKQFISRSHDRGRFPTGSKQHIQASFNIAYLTNHLRDILIKTVGVYCFFSGGVTDKKMWADYASDKGYCIEYEYTPETHSSRIRPVNYVSRRHWGGQYKGEAISARELALCPEETVTRLFTTKDIDYLDEQEFRLIEPMALLDETNAKGTEFPIPKYLKPMRAITGAKFDENEKTLLEKFDLLVRSLDVEVFSFNEL